MFFDGLGWIICLLFFLIVFFLFFDLPRTSLHVKQFVLILLLLVLFLFVHISFGHLQSALLLLLGTKLGLCVCAFLCSKPKVLIARAEVVDVVVVEAEADFISVLFGSDVEVIVLVVFLADRTERVLGVGPGEHLSGAGGTSWLCFSRESLICFW
jgi:hypothetical protein